MGERGFLEKRTREVKDQKLGSELGGRRGNWLIARDVGGCVRGF